MPFENIRFETREQIAYVTIDRPKVLNALNMATMSELRTAFSQLKEDRNVRVVILTGAGEKSFVAGVLGFKHICASSRRGKFTVHVRTMNKRLRRSFNSVAEWCRVHRHDDVSKQQATLNAKLRGHYRYYGRPTNYRSLWQFYRGVRCVWKKWLDRRSRGKTLTWEAYQQLLRRHPLLCPRITRPWAGAASRT